MILPPITQSAVPLIGHAAAAVTLTVVEISTAVVADMAADQVSIVNVVEVASLTVVGALSVVAIVEVCPDFRNLYQLSTERRVVVLD